MCFKFPLSNKKENGEQFFFSLYWNYMHYYIPNSVILYQTCRSFLLLAHVKAVRILPKGCKL